MGTMKGRRLACEAECGEDSAIDFNRYRYCFSLIELTSDYSYGQVYAAGYADEPDIRASDWFQDYAKEEKAIAVDVSWYCTDSPPNAIGAEVRIPTEEEMKVLAGNLTEVHFSLTGSCEFQYSEEEEWER